MNILSSSLEPLENRIAPAGLIDVSVSSAGILTLKTVPGLDGDESLSIEPDAGGGLLLSPVAGVTLRIGGTDFTTPQVVFGVQGLTANLGAGVDGIGLLGVFLSKSVTVNLGGGTGNVLGLNNTTVAGSVTVTGGSGADQIAFLGNVSVGGSFTAKLGGGVDVISSAATTTTASA
jgi:hypothetical protein